MTKTTNISAAQRTDFKYRCMVADKVKRARTTPVKGLSPVGLAEAARAMKIGARHLRMIEAGERLPRKRTAQKMLPWIKKRLGLEPTEKGE